MKRVCNSKVRLFIDIANTTKPISSTWIQGETLVYWRDAFALTQPREFIPNHNYDSAACNTNMQSTFYVAAPPYKELGFRSLALRDWCALILHIKYQKMWFVQWTMIYAWASIDMSRRGWQYDHI